MQVAVPRRGTSDTRQFQEGATPDARQCSRMCMTSAPAIMVGCSDANPVVRLKKPANSALMSASMAVAAHPMSGGASSSITYDNNHRMLRSRRCTMCKVLLVLLPSACRGHTHDTAPPPAVHTPDVKRDISAQWIVCTFDTFGIRCLGKPCTTVNRYTTV